MNDDLFDRAGDLKGELVTYAFGPRYERARTEVLADFDIESEGGVVQAMDYFILEHELRNGRTVLDQFVASRPDLPVHEREMLLGWSDYVHGPFEIQGRDGPALVAVNLLDDLTYRIRSNMGPAGLPAVEPGGFIVGRVVPIGQEWMISGALNLFEQVDRDHIYRLAVDLAMQMPEAVYRNPDKLAKAWEHQRIERERFLRFFGGDLVILPGEDLQERMDAYWAFSGAEAAAVAGVPARERRPMEQFPPELVAADTVGVYFDDVDGLSFYANLGRIEEAFSDPSLASLQDYREHLLEILDEESVEPSVLRRLADRDHARASELFGRVLDDADFDWRRDGEELLRRHKPWYFARERRPRFSPISERLAAAF